MQWIESEIPWAKRFDHYSNSEFGDETKRIHWFSIINSLLVVVFLSVPALALSHL